MAKTRVENRLAEIRKSRGVGASDLARRVDVSRQTIYAIEAGTYVPNTEVALNLARELEVTVDELFSLPGGLPRVARVSGRRRAQRGGAGERAAGAHLPDRIALGERSGERLALLPAGGRRHHQANRPRQRPRGPGRVCEGRARRAEAAGAGGLRPGHRSAGPHGGKDQRRGDRLRRGFQQTGAHLAQRGQGAHRRLASGRSEDRRIQSALHPQEISGRRFHRGDVCALGGGTGGGAGESEGDSQDRGSGPQERPIRESGARLGKPRLCWTNCWRRPESTPHRSRDTTASPTVTWRPPTAWCRARPMFAWRRVPPLKPSGWISFRCTASATIW